MIAILLKIATRIVLRTFFEERRISKEKEKYDDKNHSRN
jgi:hypothetical protein